MKVQMKVAIDGPAGAGKSTVAKKLADRLGLLYIDTGSMYRAVTLKALQSQISFGDAEQLGRLAATVKIELVPGNEAGCKVFLDGQDVTKAIREPQVSNHVSLVAKIPAVRKNLVKQQQDIAAHCGVVMDGRDIGTRVLPDAKAKFFLTATIEERAKRRLQDLKQQGHDISLKKLISEIAERDTMDQNRAVDPLIPSEDAIIIDSTGLTIEQVVELMVQKVKEVYA
ncbi:(d)CMP kinase [Peptococcaceae bacterium 1198_IL3148]